MSTLIASRTPEGVPGRCQVCGCLFCLEICFEPGDVPCPDCGCLAWLGESVVSASEDLSLYYNAAALEILASVNQGLLDPAESTPAPLSYPLFVEAPNFRHQQPLHPTGPFFGFLSWILNAFGHSESVAPAPIYGDVHDSWLDG